MEKAAVSQSIRNWKLLSDLKETASSVHIQGEEVIKDFSAFSRQNMTIAGQGLPSYERLINRISFNNFKRPQRFQNHLPSLFRSNFLQIFTRLPHYRN